MTDNERANLTIRLEALMDKLKLKSLTDYETDLVNALEKVIAKFITSDNLTDLQRRRYMATIIAEELDPAYKSLTANILNDMIMVGEMTGVMMMSWHGETPIQKALKFTKETLIHGYELGDMLKTNNADHIKSFKRVIATGITQGEHPTKVHRELKKLNDKRLSHVSRVVVQSAMREARWQAQQDVIKELMDRGIVKKLKWDATLDVRTCSVCANLDGKKFKSLDTFPPMPAHFRCRCACIPLTGKEKGDRKRAGQQYFTEKPKEGTSFADIPYYKWLKLQPKDVQNAIKAKHRISEEKFKELMGIRSNGGAVNKIADFEQSIIGNNFETVGIFDSSGRLLQSIKGGKHSVSLPNSMPNFHTLTHNHTNSTSFSSKDVNLFVRKADHSLVAVGVIDDKIVRYEMKKAGDVKEYLFATAEDRYNKIFESLYGKYSGKIKTEYNGNGILAMRDHTHETMEILSKELGFEYTRTFKRKSK